MDFGFDFELILFLVDFELILFLVDFELGLGWVLS